MLGYRGRAVAMAVGDDDTALASGSEIDVVGAGSADQDQLQLWAGGDAFRVDRRLVADRDPRTVQPRGDFLRLAGGMQLQLVEGGAQGAHVQVAEVEGGMVEENGAQGMAHGRFLGGSGRGLPSLANPRAREVFRFS